MANTTFWREWKSKLEEEKQLADQARMLKQILPDIDTSLFLSGDADYIKRVVFSFVDSVKLEKKHILKEAVKIAETYGLQRTEVSLTHIRAYILVFFRCKLLIYSFLRFRCFYGFSPAVLSLNTGITMIF